MGSLEGFGSGGVVVREVRRQEEVACSSGGGKDEICSINIPAPAFWSKIPDYELRMETRQASSLHSGDASKEHCLRTTNSHSLILDLDAKHLLQKSSKIVRSSSGKVDKEASKSKTGLRQVNGISSELASSPASCYISEKTQMAKQKNSSTCRRGDKRNSKVYKNKYDSFSLKNGLAGFNSAAGGNNFFGIYGLKPDVFDITRYVEELSLDELLHGRYTCPSITKDKGKKTANSNSNLLQSVRKACSLLQDQRGMQAQKCAEIDNSFRNDSTGLVIASSAAGQMDNDKGDGCTLDMPSSDKVQESGEKIKTSATADCPLYQPKDILERLALPPPKDLDSLLSETSKITNSKNCTDPRLGKQISQRTGMPPFPWSHSLSGHNKLSADAIKLSTSRTVCSGRWVKVKNSTTLQKGSDNLLMDFESLTFDQSLVPSVNLMPEHSENKFASSERVISTSGACSSSKVTADELSPTHAAAQLLLDMTAHYSKENPCAAIKLLNKPSQMGMKACKLKAIARPDKFFGAPTSTRPSNALKFCDDGSPSKKLRLSTDLTNAPSFRTPPRRLFRDSDAIKNSYGINLVKKSCMMKPPRAAERLPSSSQQKLQKSFK